MDRVDFCSVINIIKDGISPERQLGQVGVASVVFRHYEKQKETGIDYSLASRWFTGVAKVSPEIATYYLEKKDGRKYLYEDIHNEVYPRLYEPSIVMKKLKELLLLDTSISPEKKQELQKYEDSTDPKERSFFIAGLILFGIERPFVPSGTKAEDMKIEDEYSPDVSRYILCCEPPRPSRYFTGRDDELAELHRLVTEEKKVFVSGIGGIGKSELLKAYAREHKKDYLNILYFVYSGDLRQDLTEMDFADDNEKETDSERYNRHTRFLRVLREDTLLLVDNFDTTETDEPLLNEMLGYKCRIIFATRSVLEDQVQMPLGEMEGDDALFSLVGSIYPEAGEHRNTIEEIIETVHQHTLAVELCARLMRSGLHEPEQLLEKLKEQHAGKASEDKVKVKKDNRTKKDTYYGHIHTLFDLGCLEMDQRDLMRYMGLMPLSGIPPRLLASWTNLRNMNAINELIELGLIRGTEYMTINLHPMVREVVLADLIPTVTYCGTLLDSLRGIYLNFGVDVPYWRKVIEVTENIVGEIVCDDADHFILYLIDASGYVEKFDDWSAYRNIIEKMESLLSDDGVGSMKDRALLFNLKANYEWNTHHDIVKAREYQEQAIRHLPPVDSETALLAINIIHNMAFYNAKGDSPDFEKARQYIVRCLGLFNEHPQLKYSHDYLTVNINYAMYNFELGMQEEAIEELKGWLDSLKNTRMEGSLDQANIEEKIASLLVRQGRKPEAIPYFSESIQIYEKVLGNVPMVKMNKMILAGMCREAGVNPSELS